MASRNKRMFSMDIIDSDDFLELPMSSQNLYFHLAMRADDDGFITPKKIMRMIGAKEDDLKILLAKRFLLSFESGVVVIKHWLIHNTIRHDRYIETNYKTEKSMIAKKTNKSYTDDLSKGTPLIKGVEQVDDIVATDWQPSIEENSIDIEKNSKDIIKKKGKKKGKKKEIKHKYGIHKNVLLTEKEYQKIIDDGLEEMIDIFSEGIAIKNYGYKDHNLALRKWAKNQTKNNYQKKISVI